MFLKTRLSKFTSNLDPILSSIWLYFGTPNPPKSFQNRFQDALKNWSILGSSFYWFWLRFGGQLGAMLATFLGPRPSKRPPRPFQDASQTVQDASKNALERPRRPNLPWSPLALDFFKDFWSIFASNFNPLDLKKHCFSQWIFFFSKTRLSKLTSKFDPILS